VVKESSPGVEGWSSQAVTPAEDAHGQAALLPGVEKLSPALFLAGMAGLPCDMDRTSRTGTAQHRGCLLRCFGLGPPGCSAAATRTG
jgi:hypothetical protein